MNDNVCSTKSLHKEQFLCKRSETNKKFKSAKDCMQYWNQNVNCKCNAQIWSKIRIHANLTNFETLQYLVAQYVKVKRRKDLKLTKIVASLMDLKVQCRRTFFSNNFKRYCKLIYLKVFCCFKLFNFLIFQSLRHIVHCYLKVKIFQHF